MIDKINILFLLFNSNKTFYIEKMYVLYINIDSSVGKYFYFLSSKSFNLQYYNSELDYYTHERKN